MNLWKLRFLSTKKKIWFVIWFTYLLFFLVFDILVGAYFWATCMAIILVWSIYMAIKETRDAYEAAHFRRKYDVFFSREFEAE